MNGRIRLLTPFVLCLLLVFASSCGKLQRTTKIASEHDLNPNLSIDKVNTNGPQLIGVKAEEWRRRAAANDPCLALADWRGFSRFLESYIPFFYFSGRGGGMTAIGDCKIEGRIFVEDDMGRPYKIDCHNEGDILGALRCAADQDAPEAQFYLAAIYANGVIINNTPVQKDIAKAKGLLERAAANDHCRAKMYLSRLDSLFRLDPSEALKIFVRCVSSESNNSSGQ